MDTLELDELRITVAPGSPTVITWRGVSQSRSPGATLNPFFEKLVGTLEAAGEVVVSFTELKYMNSSTVSPIMNLCRLLDKKKIKTVIRYDRTSDWQASVFKGLHTLSRMMENLTVEAVEP